MVSMVKAFGRVDNPQEWSTVGLSGMAALEMAKTEIGRMQTVLWLAREGQSYRSHRSGSLNRGENPVLERIGFAGSADKADDFDAFAFA